MAKVTGPLLSMSARGQIGKSQVYAKWKGVPYARQLVIPANPQSAEQTVTRSTFAWLNAAYRAFSGGSQQPWDLASVGRPRTARNAFIAANLPGMRSETDIENLVGSAGARGGPAPAASAIVTGALAGEVDFSITPGPLPTGWTVTGAYCWAFIDQDPQAPFDPHLSCDPLHRFSSSKSIPLRRFLWFAVF